MATVLYLVLDRDTRRGGVRQRRAPAAAGARTRRAALPRGRALGAGGRGGPRGLPRGAVRGSSPARRCCSTPTGWSSAATCRSTTASTQLAEAAARRGRRPRSAVRPACWPRCWAAASRATTWRCWRCARWRPAPIRSASRCPPSRSRSPRLRRRLGRFLHAAGASEIEAYEITLAVCEAAGNAIEHAYGPGDASSTSRRRSRTASSPPRCATAGAGASAARSTAGAA